VGSSQVGREVAAGLVVNLTQLGSQARIERKPITNDHWASSPVSLPIPLKKIRRWDLHVPSQHFERKQTPALPKSGSGLRDALEGVRTEWIVLVSYESADDFPKA
jgi:hypothetical protein